MRYADIVARGGNGMKEVPGYGKVFALGSVGTEQALVGNVIVQEKIDGSQFGFGVNESDDIVLRSHHQHINIENCPNQFKGAMQHVLSLILDWVPPDTYFYCEVLNTRKHNTICYDHYPTNHLVLFDVATPAGWIEEREKLSTCANNLHIDVIPELYRGEVSLDNLRNLLSTPSYLGNSTVEGVVVKNYHENIALGGRIQPLFVKLVNEAFKETNKVDFHDRTTRGTIESYVESFRSEARWLKAVQHLREQGLLVGEPKDIGTLVREIDRDIKEEETENIKEEMFRLIISDILRKAKNGFPEWYKDRLIEWNVPKPEDILE
jgi:hypothetical protein